MRALLFQAQLVDPLVFGVAPAVLAVVCMAAAWIPSLRATRITPMDALREE